MSSGGPDQSEKPTVRFFLIFIVAAIVTLASFALNILFSLYIAPMLMPGPFGGNGFELYSLALTATSFILTPIISFLIFYKIGTKVFVKTISDHIRILTSAFAGGVAGYALAYAGFMTYSWLVHGTNPFILPDTYWLVWIAQLALGLVRSGIDLAFLAFAGVVIGALRSSRNQTVPTVSDVTLARQS